MAPTGAPTFGNRPCAVFDAVMLRSSSQFSSTWGGRRRRWGLSPTRQPPPRPESSCAASVGGVAADLASLSPDGGPQAGAGCGAEISHQRGVQIVGSDGSYDGASRWVLTGMLGWRRNLCAGGLARCAVSDLGAAVFGLSAFEHAQQGRGDDASAATNA